jgi:SNF family Na+-dependent transporter
MSLLLAVSMQQYADFFTTFYFLDTPDYVFIIVLLFSVAFIVSSGLKTVINMNDILFIGLMLTSLVFTAIVLSTPEFDYSMIRMMLHFDWDKMDQSSLLTLNWTGDIVLFLFLAPEFKTKKSPIIALI